MRRSFLLLGTSFLATAALAATETETGCPQNSLVTSIFDQNTIPSLGDGSKPANAH